MGDSRSTPFTTVAPLHDLHLGRDISFPLAPDMSIAPIPDWLRNDEQILKRLSQHDQDELALCSHCFLCEYEVDESAEMLASRRDKENYRPAKSVKVDQIYLANFALWLQRLHAVGFNLVFHARGIFISQPPARHDRFMYHPHDESHRRKITPDDLASVRSLLTALCTIPRHSAAWTAVRAVTSALQMQRNEIRHLLLWIALEALFGVADGEIRYRLSQRLAFFVADNRSEAAELFGKAKKGYEVRSRMAHGGWGLKTLNNKESLALTGVTEEFVRRAFVRLLQDDETTKIFCGGAKNRYAYLDYLPFAESVANPGAYPISTHSPEDADDE